MGKWNLYGKLVMSDDGFTIADCPKKENAEQIVREHNAHEALVELVREYREEMDDRGLMWTIKRIDAVLAQAEGRE